MANVLADLAIESEAATTFAMRVARAVDRAPHDAHEAGFARIATAVGKYWVCKRAAVFVNEAQECLGGAGYVEESMLPRLYRQAPLNSIWEGSGNIQCLDVLRALGREAQTLSVLEAELDAMTGRNEDYDRAWQSLRAQLLATPPEAQARAVTERLALLLPAAVLLRAQSPLARAFARSRLGDAHGMAFGTLPDDVDCPTVMARALP
jgi:putative acyl-CoA dehydrogenase